MIGINLINACWKRGYGYWPWCGLTQPTLHAFQAGSCRVECGLCDLSKAAGRIVDQYDAFFHLGWDGTFGDSRNDMALQTQNIRYTLDAVELAKQLGCQVFVGAGSQAEYGRVTALCPLIRRRFRKTDTASPSSVPQMSRIACRQQGIRHVWARIFKRVRYL